MKINIKTVNSELEEAISKQVDKSKKHIEKILHEKDGDSAVLDVEVGKESQHHQSGDIYTAKMHLARNGETFDAKADASDILGAVRITEADLVRQIKEEQQKTKQARRKEGRRLKDFFHLRK